MYEPVALNLDMTPPAIHAAVSKARQAPRIESTVDRGVFVDLIVTCSGGTAILSYSKVERIFCSSRGQCSPRMESAIEDSCR